MNNIYYTISVVVLLVITVFVIRNTWTLGATDDDYEIVCIGGHEYNYASFAAKGFLAIKLDDDGKPIKCIIE